ncbi:MAG: TonB-dependent receptor [Chitinophagaceae bacterium]
MLRIKVINKATQEPLPDVSIIAKGLKSLPVTDKEGETQADLPAGKVLIAFSHVGFEEFETEVTLPFAGTLLRVVLQPKAKEEEEVVIQSTRSSRSIQDIPTRVEFVSGEELDEKSNMKPGDIRMVLSESTGITTQQTSATSANASIRIQGLDGRYTQILKDGFPLYAGFSAGLGLLQTPPLDLKQFEVIKGSASTLYGGGAIAGLVNLVSKTPAEKRELKFHFDATSAGGLNTSGFYSKRTGKTGVTVFGSRNSNAPYDPSAIGLTAIPRFERYTINPKLFVYFSGHTDMTAGVNFSTEKRTGGDINYIKGNTTSGFFEENNSDRISSQFSLQHRFGKCSHISFKNSFSYFRRVILLPDYLFAGTQNGTFTEFTYASHGAVSEWIAGANLLTDDFKEVKYTASPVRKYQQLTAGLFLQYNWKVSKNVRLETGLRGDGVKDYGFVLLPRLSALFKITPKLSSRIGGGMGYKAPTLFTEESERMQYRNVQAIQADSNKLERSYGINADLNYKTKLGEVSFTVNHLFFYTRIQDPLLLQPDGSLYRFSSAPGHFDSRGMETNIKLGYDAFKLFLGYTYTKAELHSGTVKKENYLTPRHRLNTVLLYEKEDKWKAGLEAYYFSRQQLSDGTTGKPYWITGFMLERIWESISVYINFENFLDARQTRFDTIFTGSISHPQFRDIYAPLDGFVVNGGIKLRL